MGYNILIITLLDNDDRIYYDAVSDLRKVFNINILISIYGYNSGLHYFFCIQ